LRVGTVTVTGVGAIVDTLPLTRVALLPI
jgi:hypothetical protein